MTRAERLHCVHPRRRRARNGRSRTRGDHARQRLRGGRRSEVGRRPGPPGSDPFALDDRHRVRSLTLGRIRHREVLTMGTDRFGLHFVRGGFGVGLCVAAWAAACGFPEVDFEAPDTGSRRWRAASLPGSLRKGAASRPPVRDRAGVRQGRDRRIERCLWRPDLRRSGYDREHGRTQHHGKRGRGGGARSGTASSGTVSAATRRRTQHAASSGAAAAPPAAVQRAAARPAAARRAAAPPAAVQRAAAPPAAVRRAAARRAAARPAAVRRAAEQAPPAIARPARCTRRTSSAARSRTCSGSASVAPVRPRVSPTTRPADSRELRHLHGHADLARDRHRLHREPGTAHGATMQVRSRS